MTALPTLPDWFTVTCKADGRLAAGVVVGVTLHMRRRNHHFVIAGRTDRRGELVVTRDALLKEANAARKLFPADYDPVDGPNGQFGGKVEVAALTAPEIEAALKAHDQFHTVTPYPPNFRSELEAGHKALTALAPSRIDVTVTTPSPPASVSFDTDSVPYPLFPHRLLPVG